MAEYKHNMVGGPTDIVATFDPLSITYDPPESAPSGNPSDNVPDMVKYRSSWLADGVTVITDGYTEGNSLN